MDGTNKRQLIFQMFVDSMLYILGVYFTASLASLLTIFGMISLSSVSFGIIFLWYFVRRKVLTKSVIWVNCAYFVWIVAAFTISMIASEGTIDGSIVTTTMGLCAAPFLLQYFLLSLYGLKELFFIILIGNILFSILLSIYFQREKVTAQCMKKIGFTILGILVLCGILNVRLYINRPEVRYGGHGFHYMNGYSSTDFTDYMVYSNPSKLVSPKQPVAFQITKEEEMPILDGAEACYPLYASVAKVVYKDIDQIETKAMETDLDDKYRYTNGKIVSFTNTLEGMTRLINQEVDIFFGARPSREQIEEAKQWGVELEITPIGREAFVFFVEQDNPVDSLSVDQIKAIYHGELTGWQEVGGEKQAMIPFQRPKGSGSQTMMEYLMGDVSLQEPKTYEVVDSMEGVLHQVAQYHNEKGALGYSFRYFVEGLQQEENVKILAINGVLPTAENVEEGKYPLITELCVITRKENSNPKVGEMITFLLSPQGQEIVEKSGYFPVR